MNFCAAAMISSERASHSSLVCPQAVMPWPPRITPIASGCSRLMAAMSRPSWNPGRRHGTQATRSPKHSRVSFSPSAAVANAMPGVRVQVVDVRRLDQAVHGGVDRRGGAALAERAEVERGDHLVLALDPRVDAGQRAQPVEAEHRQARLGQRAEVAAGALHPHQLGRLAGDGVGRGALGRGVAARVVGVARVRAQPVGPRQQRRDRLLGGTPYVRSAMMIKPSSQRSSRAGAHK